MRRYAFLTLLPLALAGGCLNPYAGEFNCPETANGKCVSVPDAYDEATSGAAPPGQPRAGDQEYQSVLYRKLTGLLQAPDTPLVVPPKVMRVLLLPYEGDQDELYLTRYAYIFTDRPRWVLTDPAAGPEGGH
jgi:conjugal transfer pilus assembly protein TraV